MDWMEEKAARERRPLSFPQWKEALAAAALTQPQKTAHQRALIAFLGFCKRSHAPASIIVIQQYLAQLSEQARSGAREALRWWYRAAGDAAAGLKLKVEVEGRGAVSGAAGDKVTGDRRADDGGQIAAEEQMPDARREARRSGGSRKPASGERGRKTEAGGQAAVQGGAPEAGLGATGYSPRRQAGTPPPVAASDLGATEWERDLIKACRERNFLWRTERTYRDWAARFAAFLRPRSPYRAEAEDVAAFLSRMAVEERASVSAQKQALNALVFLMQEALHRQLGEIDFHRSRKPKRVPMVLSQGECQRLFAQLTGVTQLMAELAYGSGLRLMELLRLRVHHLDRVEGFAPRGSILR